MSWLLVMAGAALLVVTAYDMVKTTLAVGAGGGPLTQRLALALWRVFTWARRAIDDDRALQVGGVVILVATLGQWILLLWGGWVLIFSAGATPLVDTTTRVPVEGLAATIYFTGYTTFGLGIGDIRPSGALWQLLTMAACVTGVSLLSLAVSYLIPVLSAVVEKRVLAAEVADLGQTPSEVVSLALDPSTRPRLEARLGGLAPSIRRTAERHLAYPVLHFFHTARRPKALAVHLAVLDEALTTLQVAGRDDLLAPEVALPIRSAISDLLDTLERMPLLRVEEAPPPPSFEALEEAAGGALGEREAELQRLAPRRRTLLSLVTHDGWTWEDVVEADEERPRLAEVAP